MKKIALLGIIPVLALTGCAASYERANENQYIVVKGWNGPNADERALLCRTAGRDIYSEIRVKASRWVITCKAPTTPNKP